VIGARGSFWLGSKRGQLAGYSDELSVTVGLCVPNLS
jgi:hypothetical protein